ncbi:HlyD family type I secretion periplasmic adaptor subunit [Marinobacter halophilus]|uniref:Membrane fusion protein (MFP) family protein n=1 Tax=Marinobacter halophilus TaxID=1323740 RepID=A0A2T1KBI4_9GAMM|nr:HlyD family type I secretion periplasmic adaptor subunit [Marinobacter halophilus]PSF07499.1 HlyD family type I secretion periplasmic adaptor subunit [Marinobacter halophilus]
MTKPSGADSPKTQEQKRFEATAKVSESLNRGAPALERFLKRWSSQPDLSDWRAESSWAQIQQSPLRARSMLYVGALVILALIIWAYFAPLEEVTRGEGKIIPSSQLQIVQSLDGGIVKTIEVTEGQRVEKGQILMRLDKTRSLSDIRERQARILNLEAETSRLRAQIAAELPIFDPALAEKSPQLIDDQTSLYLSSLEELKEQQSGLEEQRIQRQQDLEEALAASRQAREVKSLAQQELDKKRPLLRSGAVSDVDILQLEREIARANGDLERAQASTLRAEAGIRESSSRLSEAKLTFQNRWRSELADAQVRLNALLQEESGLADRVQQTDIRSPVLGIVQRIFSTTVGGVVLPGKELLEIVPVDDQLIVEARVSPVDIAFLRPGLPATVKLTAYDFNIFGGLQAELEHISADTITDDQDNTFYLVRLRTLENEISNSLPIIPGMTAEVDIITGEKTILNYLLKPVLRATSEAMRER